MAWFRTGGGGEALSETVLWTNPSPTSDFASQEITLSDGMSNYKYIRIYYKASKSDSTMKYVDFTSEFMNDAYETSNSFIAMIGVSRGSGSNVGRPIIKVSDTVLRIRAAYQLSATTGYNGNAIPVTIRGLK